MYMYRLSIRAIAISMINFYSRTKAKKAHDPNYAIHGIQLPARILLCGAPKREKPILN
jgi:hypothetical protein